MTTDELELAKDWKQAVEDGDTDTMVKLAFSTGCAAMSGETAVCRWVFEGGFVDAMNWVFDNLIPTSWKATGVTDYAQFTDVAIPVAQRQIEAIKAGVKYAWDATRQALGLPPAEYDFEENLRQWVYGKSGKGWNEGGIVHIKSFFPKGHYLAIKDRTIALRPPQGLWAVSWYDWPKTLENQELGRAFARMLWTLYATKRVQPVSLWAKSILTHMPARLREEGQRPERHSPLIISMGDPSPSWVEVSGVGALDPIDALNERIGDLDDRIQATSPVVRECIDSGTRWDSIADAWYAIYDMEENVSDTTLEQYLDEVTLFEAKLAGCSKRDPSTPTKPPVPDIEPPKKTPPIGPSPFLSDLDARTVLERIWSGVTGESPTLPELQIAQAIGRFEGRYGVKQDGTVHNNWGGVQCLKGPPCPAGCFEYGDVHGDGRAYRWCLRRYDSPDKGAADMLRLITTKRPSVWAAMKRGDTGEVASEMRRTGYHETKATKYRDAIYSNAQTIARNLGETLAVRRTATHVQKDLSSPALALGLALLGLIVVRRRKRG